MAEIGTDQIEWKSLIDPRQDLGIVKVVSTWKVWGCAQKGWTEDPPVTLRNTLLGAMHPNNRFVIGEVSTEATDPNLLNPFKPESDVTYQLDLASGARTHGRFTFGNDPIGPNYYGPSDGDQWKRIIYGSILHTGCKNLIFKNLTFIILDDVADEQNPDGWNTGDSHAKCSEAFMKQLRGNLHPELEPGVINANKPVQFRLAIADTMVGKGTVSYNPKLDNHAADLVIPISCLKGNKPNITGMEQRIYEEQMMMGIVFEAEQRQAKGGWMLFQWFSFEALEQDGIISDMEEKCTLLVNAYGDIKVLADLLRIDVPTDDERIENEENGAIGEVEYVNNFVKIIQADINGLLLTHPWVISRLNDRLREVWLNLAKAAGVRFYSLMAQPDESLAHYHTVLPNGTIDGQKVFCAPDYPEGEYILFINPMRHWGDTQIWENKHEGTYVDATGIIAAPRLLLLSLGRDTDGDFIQLIEASKYPAIADEIRNFSDSPAVEKLPKVALSGDLRAIALGSMNDMTGVVATLLGRARTGGVENIVLNIPPGGEQTEAKEMRIIDFLSQELQIAVDSLKSAYPNNTNGLNAVGSFLDSVGAEAPWLKGFKNKDVYKTIQCPVHPTAMDTVSRLVRLVNSYWQPANFSTPLPVKDFQHTLYGVKSGIEFDDNQLNIANEIRINYGREMGEAIAWKESHDGDPTKIKQVIAKYRAIKQDLVELANDDDKVYSAQSWSAAFWYAAHNTENPQSKAGACFAMFTDEICEHLLEIKDDSAKVLSVYGVLHGAWAAPRSSPLWNGEIVNMKTYDYRQGGKSHLGVMAEWPEARQQFGYHHLGVIKGRINIGYGVMKRMKIYSISWREGKTSAVMLFALSLRQEEIYRLLSGYKK